MGPTTISMLTLAGAALVIFAVISIARGKITYVDGDRSRKLITRTGSSGTFWFIALGILAVGVALLVTAYFFGR